MRANRKEEEIPLNPFTAGVYIATMMATVEVLREKVGLLPCPTSAVHQFSSAYMVAVGHFLCACWSCGILRIVRAFLGGIAAVFNRCHAAQA